VTSSSRIRGPSLARPLPGQSSQRLSTAAREISTAGDAAATGRDSSRAAAVASPAFEEPLHVGRPNIGDRQTFIQYVNEMFDRRWLTNDGPLVRAFEARVAQRLNVRHCICTCNGTMALAIAVRALQLRDEVIVPSFTFVALAHALQWQGLTPVFANIDPRTHNLDPASVERSITPRTTGIIGVHLWGRAAPHAELNAIAQRHGLQLMYDAAHAFGCSLGGRLIGNFGACEVLSFHATKVVNAFEGGALVTNDDRLAEKARYYRNFGFAGLDHVVETGTNGKMPEVCAAMGLTSLDHLDAVVETNRGHYLAYQDALREVTSVSLIEYDERERNNYHYVVLCLGDSFAIRRDTLVQALRAENVLARRYFWPGCHRMAPFRERFTRTGRALLNTERVAERVVVLPTGTALPDGATEQIVDIVKRVRERS